MFQLKQLYYLKQPIILTLSILHTEFQASTVFVNVLGEFTLLKIKRHPRDRKYFNPKKLQVCLSMYEPLVNTRN